MYANGDNMSDFENLLDEIRIELFEETKDLDKADIMSSVNSHAQKIAQEYGIYVKESTEEGYSEAVNA